MGKLTGLWIGRRAWARAEGSPGCCEGWRACRGLGERRGRLVRECAWRSRAVLCLLCLGLWCSLSLSVLQRAGLGKLIL